MNKQQLFEHIQQKQSFLCVGLDTDIKKIPQHLLNEEDPIFAFNKAIIDATAAYCVAYKPNLAFYESLGVKGLAAFEKTVAYLRAQYPDQFIIADAKRGDIGNTSELYARSFFEHTKVDAVTVAPYMGEDSVKPFLIYPEAWVILLALTSNKGSHDFQLTIDAEGERLFEKVLRKSSEWATDEQMMYVFVEEKIHPFHIQKQGSSGNRGLCFFRRIARLGCPAAYWTGTPGTRKKRSLHIGGGSAFCLSLNTALQGSGPWPHGRSWS